MSVGWLKVLQLPYVRLPSSDSLRVWFVGVVGVPGSGIPASWSSPELVIVSDDDEDDALTGESALTDHIMVVGVVRLK